MTGRTADSLVSALMLDRWPSLGAITDFGLTETNYGAYQRLIRAGTLTADTLHAHAGDDAWLSEQIGMPVETPWGFILEVDDDDDEEVIDGGAGEQEEVTESL